MLQYHPDKYDLENVTCSREEAKDYFHLIDKAWKTLSDSKTRIEYDATLRGRIEYDPVLRGIGRRGGVKSGGNYVHMTT